MARDNKRHEDLNQLVRELVLNAGAIDVGSSRPRPWKADRRRPTCRTYWRAPSRPSSSPCPWTRRRSIGSSGKRISPGTVWTTFRTNTFASGIALELAGFLEMKGHAAVAVESNFVYRKDTPRGPYDEKPPISHRYLAARAGLGHFGLSGNVLRKKEGAAILFGSVVTDAQLTPTGPLPAEENYCDDCRLCMAACASALMHPQEKTTVTMGGVGSDPGGESYNRCDYVCGGFTGLSKSGKWSTWSPARFPIPENDKEFLDALRAAVKSYAYRPKPGIVFHHALLPGNKGQMTCRTLPARLPPGQRGPSEAFQDAHRSRRGHPVRRRIAEGRFPGGGPKVSGRDERGETDLV